MKKLVLIDGNSLFNRAFYATPVFTTRNGTPTNAIFGFVKLTFKILEDIKPDYILVAFDMHAPTFRHNMFDGYKATRKPMPPDLAVQVEPLKNLLTAMKIAICGKEGIEADDILGTISKKFDVHSYIYTGDRDSFQLVDEKTDVLFTRRGVSDVQWLTNENFVGEVGITPSQVVDLKAMMGDKSDNIPGVPGIGEKTAKGLLASYGTLEGVYAHSAELSDKLRTKFEENREIAELSYKLATINRDCDLDVTLGECVAPSKYNEDVRRIFTELEFNSFLGMDIFEENGASVRREIKYPEKTECTTYSQVGGVIAQNSRFAVVLDDGRAEIYTGGWEYSFVFATSLFTDNCIDISGIINVLCDIFCNPTKTVICFDCKQTMHRLEALGIVCQCSFEDLGLVKYLCDYNDVATDFKALCQFYSYDSEYSAFALSELFDLYYKRLQTEGMVSLYEDIEKPLLEILFGMESDGVKVSLAGLEDLGARYRELIEKYRRKIYDGCGTTFNINSPAQLGKALYERLGITEVKKKKTEKYTTSADVLEKLVDQYPIVADVLKFRLFQKLYSTYIEGFRPLIDKTSGIVHTTYHQTATSTGRLSSSNPNLQNIPIREDEGRELRKIFIPREGRVFIDADYSQIELRLLAHFSGCKELISAYNNGIDIHAVTASQVFGVPIEQVTPHMRRSAKAVNFGIIYGISDFGLSRNLNIPLATAREYIEKYFSTYSAVREYMNSNVEFARKNGYVSTLTGRKRVIAEINSPNYNLRQFGERAAMNMPLQGSSADIIKIAMIRVCKSLKEGGLKARLVLQVHDELVLEAPEDEAEKASRILKEGMENAVKLQVPLTVDVHVGKNWYEAK